MPSAERDGHAGHAPRGRWETTQRDKSIFNITPIDSSSSPTRSTNVDKRTTASL